MIDKIPALITIGYDEWYKNATDRHPEIAGSGDMVLLGELTYIESVGWCYKMYNTPDTSCGYLPQSFAQLVKRPEKD